MSRSGQLPNRAPQVRTCRSRIRFLVSRLESGRFDAAERGSLLGRGLPVASEQVGWRRAPIWLAIPSGRWPTEDSNLDLPLQQPQVLDFGLWLLEGGAFPLS